MVFTARPIAAERAERLGIINHLVAVEELEPVTYELARNIAENAPLSVSVMKEQLRMLAGAHPMSPRRFDVREPRLAFELAKAQRPLWVISGHW